MKTSQILLIAALLLCAVPAYTQFCEFRYTNASVCRDVYNCPATGGLGYVRKTFMFPTVQCPINGTFCYLAHTDETYTKCVSIQKCNLCQDPSKPSTCEGCVPLTKDVVTQACDANQCHGLNYTHQDAHLPTAEELNSSCEFRYVNESVCTDAFNCSATGGLGYVRKTFIFATVQCPINETFCYIAHTDETGLKCVNIEKCDSCSNQSELGTCVGCVPLTSADFGLHRQCANATCWGLNYSAGTVGTGSGSGSGTSTSNAGDETGANTYVPSAVPVSASVGGNTVNVNEASTSLGATSSGITITTGMVVSVIITVTACLMH